MIHRVSLPRHWWGSMTIQNISIVKDNEGWPHNIHTIGRWRTSFNLRSIVWFKISEMLNINLIRQSKYLFDSTRVICRPFKLWMAGQAESLVEHVLGLFCISNWYVFRECSFESIKGRLRTSQGLGWGGAWTNKIVSSAQKWTFRYWLVLILLLLVYNVNSNGPRVDPCGNPFLMVRRFVWVPSATRVWVLSVS